MHYSHCQVANTVVLMPAT